MTAGQDCYWQIENDLLSLGNSLIERTFKVDKAGMTPLCVWDKQANKRWMRPEQECLLIPSSAPIRQVRITGCMEDHAGLSEPHLAVHVCWVQEDGGSLERIFEVYPHIPMVTMRALLRSKDTLRLNDEAGEAACSGVETAYAGRRADAVSLPDAVDVVMLPRGHYQMKEVLLLDVSDRNDTLVREHAQPLYVSGWGRDEAEGTLFFIEDRLDGQGLLLVKESPTVSSMLGRKENDLIVTGNRALQLVGSGLDGQAIDMKGVWAYGSTVGVGKASELAGAWRALYRAIWRPRDQVRVLSNTWGDRNQDKALCHDFILREIDMASRLGVQVVQLDDGWQQGVTANSALKKGGVWEGYYAQDPDFWQPNQKKFPHGLAPLVEYAQARGIELGLWFSPDSSGEFANWERDAAVLTGFYRTLGIRRFKLDGVKIRSKIGERNYLFLLDALNQASGGQICVNQDITAEVRLGQLYFREYGNLFVENRYTDFGSYYPHNTLKNLWQLSRYVPAGRMQFECLNPGRNIDKYPPNDPFAPRSYTMDYLFAVTMVASPLIWMEMSHLSEADAACLQRIISLYLPHQENLHRGDTRPIGEMPDGQSFTGFHTSLCEEGGYLTLFREVTRSCEAEYALPELAGRGIVCRVVASNLPKEGYSLQWHPSGALRVRMEQPRAYLLARYDFQR